MACFQKRSGAWRAIVKRKGYQTQTRTFDTKTEAEAWARQIEGEIDRGVFVSRSEAERTTLSEALSRYAREVVPSKKNTDREGRRVQAFQSRSLAHRSMASIQGKDIAAFVQRRQAEGAGPNTVRLDLALLSHLFSVKEAISKANATLAGVGQAAGTR